MRYFYILFLLLSSPTLFAANLPPGFVEAPLATGLDPTAMAQAPDGRIFITEKYGAVRIVENGVLLPDPFILLPVDNFNERGLSGIAFDPEFAQNRYVYLYYTVPLAGHNRLSRVRAMGNFALPGSEEVLLELDPMPGAIHNAGAMAFGPDGKLYLAVGEGADGAKAQSLNSLLGKILRLNPDGAIPDDNPFYQQTSGIYRAIFAVGLRNPFSMAIQPGTGRIFAGDVGSYLFEEINHIEGGKDYGWNLLEGKRNGQPVPDNYRDPLYYYGHTLGCAVTGAAFYNPPSAQFPAAYIGKFFYGDYCNTRIKYLNPETGLVEGTFATNIDRPIALLTGLKGELYYISRGGIGGGSEGDNTSSNEGVLWRVEYVGNGAPVFSIQPKNVLVPAGEDAAFSADANGGQPIQYRWQRDGQDIPGATAKDLTLGAVTLPDSGAVIRCIAKNLYGQIASAEAVLRVTANQRPLPVILEPPAGLTYSAGDTIRFSGYAFDPETGDLADGELIWQLELMHDQHAHPGLGPVAGVASGFYVVPRVGETDDNVWLRIHLTARDPAGLSGATHRDIFPEKTLLRLQSTPSGLPMRIDGKTYYTPFEISSVKGLFHQVQAQALFPGKDTLRVFQGWQDGEMDANRTLFADENKTTLHALYEDITLSGTGLYGLYHTLNSDTAFGQLLFTQIDTTLHFDWGKQPPDARLGAEHYAIRWLGAVEPVFSEWYYFHVNSDDGFRLWVNDSLVAQAWKIKGTGEISGAIFLEKGRKYDIRLDYFEFEGDASVKLFWSGASTPKEIIPKKHLFPRLPENPNGGANEKFDLLLAPNPVRNVLALTIDADFQETFHLQLIDASGRLVREWRNQRLEAPGQRMIWPVAGLQAGMYWLELEREGAPRVVRAFVKL